MKRKAFKAAFPYTLPILAGFSFLGMAYGIYMNASGFSFIYPLCMSFLIYGGSLEFVAVEMLEKIWKRNMFLSIAAGTISYMLLLHFCDFIFYILRRYL